jgi:hypothetical protein
MGYNPVFDSIRPVIVNPQYVFINETKLMDIAQNFAKEDLKIPQWNAPNYPPELNNQTIDFIFLENTINFAFTDFKTKEKFTTNYQGRDFKGSAGMVACLKRALDSNIPILEGDFLKNVTKEKMQEIFSGNFEIPMLTERHKIFNEVGKVLTERYDGHFYNLVNSRNKCFNQGEGAVERLVYDFPSFNDSVDYYQYKVIFNKRAQLACAILYEKFLPQKRLFEDIDSLSVFADYVLPKGLRDLGILEYESLLSKRVDNQEIIDAGSREEIEIRASTIQASKLLVERINEIRNNVNPVNALHIDYKLWSESRKISNGKPHHLTPTIAY